MTFIANLFIFFTRAQCAPIINEDGQNIHDHSVISNIIESSKYNNKQILQSDFLSNTNNEFNTVCIDSSMYGRKICLLIPLNSCSSCIFKTLHHLNQLPIEEFKDDVIAISSFDVCKKYNIKKEKNNIIYLQYNIDRLDSEITDLSENPILFFVEDAVVISSYILTPDILLHIEVIVDGACKFLNNI